MLIANATGCSSIYCGSTPGTPFTTNSNGDGVAWANSLFEDNAEYGFGMRLANDYKLSLISSILSQEKDKVEPRLQEVIDLYLDNIKDRKKSVSSCQKCCNSLKKSKNEAVKETLKYKDDFDKSVWIIGGDGWAYDIGFGGLDHVLASGANVNILVLDTEVYSNTGGQMSKSQSSWTNC